MPSNKSKTKSNKMESDDQEKDSPIKMRTTRSTKTVQTADTNTKSKAEANKRAAKKNGVLGSSEDKASKFSDNHADTGKPAKRPNRRIQISAKSAAAAVSNIEANSSENDETTNEDPPKPSRGTKAPKRAATKSNDHEESAAPKGRKVTQKGRRKTAKRMVKKVDEPEDEDVDELEGNDAEELKGNDADELKGNDADELKGNDADELKGNDADELKGNDADELEGNDADELEGNDADELEGNDADRLKGNDAEKLKGNDAEKLKGNDAEELKGNNTEELKGNDAEEVEGNNDEELESNNGDEPKKYVSKGKAVLSKVRDGDYDLSNDVHDVDFFNLPKTTNKASKKGSKKTSTKPTAEEEEQPKSSRVKNAEGGRALAKKTAKLSIQLKKEIPIQDDEKDNDIAQKTTRGRKAPVKKTGKIKAEITSQDDSEISADDDNDGDVAPKRRTAPIKKSGKKTSTVKVEVPSQDGELSSSDGESKDLKGHKSDSAVAKDKVPSQDANNVGKDDAKVLKLRTTVNDDDNKDSQDASNDEDEPTTTKGRKNTKGKKPPIKKVTKKNETKSSGKVKNEEEEVQLKTVVIKGKAPVDPECVDKVSSSHVYCENDTVYDAMLNQTNVQNNNNKFYLLQVLEDDLKFEYSVWFRWGRVGVKGQCQLTDCGSDLDKAKKMFEHKFKDKTKNEWSDRLEFEKVTGKYDLLAIDYGSCDNKPIAIETKVEEKEEPKSKLDSKLQSFIKLIFNIKAMEATVMEMKYDANKAPLGKLTTEQVTAGYSALKKIEECITENKMGKELIEACNVFYTRIPHVFGMKRPPLIQNAEDLAIKIELLKMLGDIQVAMTILNEKVNIRNNPIDSHYESLKCNMKPIFKDDSTFLMVNDYLQNTHAATHRTYNMELVDLFDCTRDLEEGNYKDVGNRMLLWHGSRLTNTVGILKQGLRIAPPEAPSTGYMFGKGVYFADMSSKSANYCYTSSSQNEGILYLCEVSVGTPNKLLSSNYDANKLPDGYHSVLGQGSVAPDPKMFKTLPNGTIVPMGNGIDSGVKNPSGYTLNYNEYIVYDVNQIKLRYVLRVKFLYNY